MPSVEEPRTGRPGINLSDSGLGVFAVWMNIVRFWNEKGDDDRNATFLFVFLFPPSHPNSLDEYIEASVECVAAAAAVADEYDDDGSRCTEGRITFFVCCINWLCIFILLAAF